MKVDDAEQSQLDDGFPLCVGVPHHHLGVHHHPSPRALLVGDVEVLRGGDHLLGSRDSTSPEAPSGPKISPERLRRALAARVVPAA